MIKGSPAPPDYSLRHTPSPLLPIEEDVGYVPLDAGPNLRA